MEKYIALLRGINVGGNNKISMAQLKTAFEEYNFKNVATYINSGNVIFESQCLDQAALKETCEELIVSRFKLSIAVSIISAKELAEALAHAPHWWDYDSDSKHNAIFVISPATAETILEEVGAMEPEHEKASYHGKVIFWSAPIKTFSKTNFSKYVSKKTSSYITIRNSNTAKKLCQLCD